MYNNKYVLELIKDAIEDELLDYNFYNELAQTTENAENKSSLLSMSLDEKKHNKMFSDIYTKLTGTDYIPQEQPEKKELSPYFLNNVALAINEELDAVEKYRPILFALENPQFKNYLLEIITDEQKHATKLNYMYSKNK